MSLTRGAYQPTQQRSPVIEETSGVTGADLHGITTLYFQAAADLLLFSPSTINAVLGVVAAQLPGALGDLAENHGQAAFTETLLSNRSIGGVP
jgi:hypothetical protein